MGLLRADQSGVQGLAQKVNSANQSGVQGLAGHKTCNGEGGGFHLLFSMAYLDIGDGHGDG